MNFKLITPNKKYKKSFYQMVEDYDNYHELDYPKYYDRSKDSFDDYLVKLSNLKKGIDLKPGFSATETFWLINSNNYILGTIRFRKDLNEYTLNDGGNIGYDICPSFRNKGFGNLILKLLLEKLSDVFKNKKMLITCESDNIPSNKIVIKNGGILENKEISKRTGKEINRYWVQINTQNSKK